MKTLAIDTSGKDALIAITGGKKDIFFEMDSSSKHSENLLKNIEQNLSGAEIGKADITNLVVVVGPGSFTGLRIGIATAKAMMTVNKNIKTTPLTSLELLAFAFFKNSDTENAAVITDALGGRYFFAKFSSDNKIPVLHGSISLVYPEDISLMKGEQLIADFESDVFSAKKITVCPEDLLELGLKKIQTGNFILEEELVPLYIRKSQAEDNIDNKN